jgi:hypothetical protein
VKSQRAIIRMPETYEQLVAQLQRQHPTWSKPQVERHIAEKTTEQDRKRKG